ARAQVARPPLQQAPAPLQWGASPPTEAPASDASPCATLSVPLNHADPEGERLALTVRRSRATGPGPSLGTLVVLDGAPGAADALPLEAIARALPAALRSRLDLVSWRRRGTGRRGDPAALRCWPTEERARSWSDRQPPGVPVGSQERARWLESWAELARACGRHQAALLPHLSSADSARDLELLRQSLGEPTLRLRASGVAALVGATYANLYPSRVRAMVLDGAPDPLAWSDNGNPEASEGTLFRLERDLSAGATMVAFLRQCAAVGRPRCAFAATGPGGSQVATERQWAELRARLARGPLRWGGRRLTLADVLGELERRLRVVPPDGEGRGGWEGVGRFLNSLARGGGDADETAAEASQREAVAPEQALATLCGESPNPRQGEEIEGLATAARSRSGPFGPWVVWADARCAAWPRAAAPYSGPWTTPTPVSVLVIAHRFDPHIPFQSSLGMARELERGRLLSVNGHGHTVLRNPSACVARYETAYILSGLVPPLGTVCGPDVEPFRSGSIPGGRSLGRAEASPATGAR
ncbi:MAG: alpha/beta hydrolase, partial [Cyanobacteriota bacterium]